VIDCWFTAEQVSSRPTFAPHFEEFFFWFDNRPTKLPLAPQVPTFFFFAVFPLQRLTLGLDLLCKKSPDSFFFPPPECGQFRKSLLLFLFTFESSASWAVHRRHLTSLFVNPPCIALIRRLDRVFDLVSPRMDDLPTFLFSSP